MFLKQKFGTIESGCEQFARLGQSLTVTFPRWPLINSRGHWVDDDCRLLDRQYVTGKFVGGMRVERHLARFSLNATSPKCVIMVLALDLSSQKIYVNLCSPGDISWRTLEFNCGLGSRDRHLILSVVYANGALGLCEEVEEACALFLGRTSFAVLAVGEVSVPANTIVYCGPDSPSVRYYGSTCTCVSGTKSPLYRKCVEATKCAMAWIQIPSAGIWTADDLIKAKLSS
ncbi:hypothetical protein GQ457_13G008730 [Hibiscus cannabinus]